MRLFPHVSPHMGPTCASTPDMHRPSPTVVPILGTVPTWLAQLNGCPSSRDHDDALPDFCCGAILSHPHNRCSDGAILKIGSNPSNESCQYNLFVWRDSGTLVQRYRGAQRTQLQWRDAQDRATLFEPEGGWSSGGK
jgi:hypothetical protein